MATHQPHPPTKTNQTLFLKRGLIIGAVLGYPLSYYFQPSALRAKLSLSGYIGEFSNVIGDETLASNVLVGFVVSIVACAAIGYLLGKSMDEKR